MAGPSPAMTTKFACRLLERLAQKPRPFEAITPRRIDRLGDADPWAGDDLGLPHSRPQLERRPVQRQPVMLDGHAQRLRQFARSRAQRPDVRQVLAAPPPQVQQRRQQVLLIPLASINVLILQMLLEYEEDS